MNKRTLYTLHHLHTIRVSSLVNRILYYSQKIPFLGRVIHNEAYANFRLKKVVSIIAIVLQLLWGLSKPLMFLAFMVFLPMSLRDDIGDNQLIWMLHIILWLSFIISFVSSTKVLEPTREKYVAVKQMRMSPTDYMQAYFTNRYMTYAIYYTVPMIIFVKLAGGKVWQALLLVITLTLWKILSEIVHLKIYERSKLILIKHNGYVWLTIIIGFVIAYGALFTGIEPTYSLWLLNPIVAILIIIAGIFAWIKLYAYNNFREIVDAATKRDDPLLDLNKMITDSQKISIEKELTKVDSAQAHTLPSKIEQLKGYAYLHAIFMHRHRALFADKLKKRLLIIAAIGFLGIIIPYIKPELATKVTDAQPFILVYLYLIMSMFSIGSVAIYSFFYHCDVNLISQSFYRQGAKHHYLIRLKMILLHNGILASALSLALTTIIIINSGWIPFEISLIWVGAFAYSSFISVHQLFMYYMLQPYSRDMKMKNPFFFLSNMLVSFIWFILLILNIRGLSFVAFFVVLTVLYMIISIFVVNKFAQRTFRIR